MTTFTPEVIPLQAGTEVTVRGLVLVRGTPAEAVVSTVVLWARRMKQPGAVQKVWLDGRRQRPAHGQLRDGATPET